ncbi:Diphosphomevalonate decarboxylase [uncultured archaeon]|nr:Diphosphomevalonate decarboxylase [uncultured archaeon]
MPKILRATAEANPNIAIIKYWGKRDEKLILPMQGSNSVTLDEQLKTRTTVMFSDKFRQDEIWINNKQLTTPEELEKVMPQLNIIREMAKIRLKAKVVSYSVTPVAGGLAGSAAGLAAVAYAATNALGMNLSISELSVLCRLGSGSACRSVYGGFAEWKRGEKADGSDSFAVQIADEKHWPDFRIVVGVAESGEKKVKSRAGMKHTVANSILYSKRLEYLPKVLKESKDAILKKDASRLFEIAMRDSNDMHATMHDTWPPIMYLNDASKEVIYAIHELNQNGIKAGYSFDAGPNPTIFTLDKHVAEVKKILENAGIKKMFVSNVGSGPKILKDEIEHLIDENGNIRKHSFDEKKNMLVIEY